MYTQYDPGSNVTIFSEAIVIKLGIPVILFQATFCQAAGAKEICKASWRGFSYIYITKWQ